ncbi:hypothetical protein [Phenylobacterium sp.]|uniref:hypothetical protein n=1 Tax=Phenylobacterium sp. TaxID=1871053 RepID=UPI001991D8C7|nr:hypothetical protein [Phenylobacterium sp.]MBC7169067.1 hypothetical protein [Phenylobacterium sp.]
MSRPPEPTSADFATWRRLLRLARNATSDPAAPCGDLAKAERKAKRATLLGPESASNPFIRLVRLSRQYAASTVRQRRELSPQLIEVCDLVEIRLKGATGGEDAEAPPARRHRADLDG